MSNPQERIRELGWRQRLRESETTELKALLATHPESAAELEGEKELTSLLEKIPPAPAVASNFTAQVMAAVRREKAASERFAVPRGEFLRRFQTWLPRLATLCVILLAGIVAVHERQVHSRAIMAKGVEQVADAFSTLGQDPVKHFDPITRLSEAPPAADTELTTLVASMQ
jgi:anti-sigma factor RsiW